MAAPFRDTATARRLVIIIIRAFAIVVVVSVFVAFGRQLLSHIPYGWGRFTDRPIYAFRDEIVWALPLVAVAVALWLGQKRLARFVVPQPRHECPECGYSLHNLRTKRCPECGCAFAGDAQEPQT